MALYPYNGKIGLPETPVVIDWKGKIGYGDIVSPISYAHNIAEKNTCDVHLNFHWKQAAPTKFKSDDPETIQDWIESINNEITPAKFFDVKVNHVYDNELSFNHTNYVDDGIFHNMRFAKHGMSDYNYSKKHNNTIAFVTTLENKVHFKDYDKSKLWKDPLGDTPDGNAWRRVGDLFRKRGYNIVYLHYNTSIETCIDVFKRCAGVVGYHGSLMWLARMYGCPMVIFSKGSLTKRAFPWAITFKYWYDYEIKNTSIYFEQSIQKRNELLDDYNYYLTFPNLHRLRGERT